MPEFLSEQFVRLRPDLSTFRQETEQGVAAGLAGVGRSTAGVAAGQALGTAVAAGFRDRTRRIEVAGLTGATLREQRPIIERAVAESLASVPGVAGASGRQAGLLFGASFSERVRASLVGLRATFGGTPIIGTTAIVGGAILAGQALRSIVSEGGELEARLNELRIVSGATGDDMARLGDRARELGSDLGLPAVSAGDATLAMTELSKAGIEVTDVLDGTRGVLELGAAANIDFAASAEIVASALNAFRLPGEDASRVADLLAGAANAAQGDIADFAVGMQQATAAAAQIGVPIEDAVTALTLLARAGIQGSDAGTSLRVTLLRLVPQTKAAADVINALGVQIADQEGRLRPLADIFEDYRNALAKLPPVTRQAALTTLFGADAFRAASIFAEAGAQGFAAARDEITQVGIAADAAGAKAEGLIGAGDALSSSWETFAATLSRLTNPAIEGTARAMASFISSLDRGTNAVFDATEAAANLVFPSTDVAAADVGELADEIETLSRSLAGMDVGEAPQGLVQRFREVVAALAEVDPARLEAAFASSSSAIGQAIRDGIITPTEVARLSADDLGQEFLTVFLGLEDDIAAAGQAFVKGLNDLVATVDKSMAGLAARPPDAFLRGVESLAPDARAAGRQVGDAVGDGIEDGIDASERRIIGAARRSLQRLREEAARALTDAVRSARENFESLGDAISQSLADVLDASPLGQKIEEVDRQLEALQGRVSRRQLRFDLTEAEQDLEDARKSIVRVGEVTPEMRRQQQEFLAPFQERLADAKSSLKEFTLAEHRDDLQATLEKQKQTAEQGVLKLVAAFDDGRLSVAQFNQQLTQRLGPALDVLKTKAGDNLGLRIRRDFLRDVENLRAQAEAIAGFLGRTGTAPGTNVIRPADTQADFARQIADAQRELVAITKEARREQATSDGQSQTIRLLGQIRDALKASPKAPTSRRGVD